MAAGVLLFGGGLISFLFPQAAVLVHPTMGPWGNAGTSLDIVGPAGARRYGVLAILVGLGLVLLVHYPPKPR